jgi:hypothetical protein
VVSNARSGSTKKSVGKDKKCVRVRASHVTPEETYLTILLFSDKPKQNIHPSVSTLLLYDPSNFAERPGSWIPRNTLPYAVPRVVSFGNLGGRNVRPLFHDGGSVR